MENKKYSLKYWMKVVSIVFGIIAIFMLFLPSMRATITVTGKEVGVYNGFQTMFGYNETSVTGKEVNVIGFSFVNFLSALLVLVGVCLTALGLFNVKALAGKGYLVVAAVAVVALLAGGILAFFTVNNVSIVGEQWRALTVSLCEGAILQGVFAIVSGVCAIVPVLLDTLAKKQ